MNSRSTIRAALASVAAVGVTAAAVGFADTGAVADPAPAKVSAAAALPTLSTDPLDILLTNDDGWNAQGINAVYDALVADGHHVTMVAPAANQSGVSARIDFSGMLTATHPVPGDDNIWSVSTSPAGTVLFALDAVLKEQKPDLIISGSNVGANTGFDTNFSGTIGAATVGSGMFDIPSIAVSTATAGYTPDAPGAFDETADLLVELLDNGLPVLPRGQFLNINYPVLTDAQPAPKGYAYVSNSQASAAAFHYIQQQDDPTQYKIQGARGTEVPAPGTDSAMLKEGWVTFGVLDADRSVDAADAPEIADIVRELNGDPVPVPPAGKVQKIARVVAAGSSVWAPTSNLADGTELTVTWRALGGHGKSRTTTETVEVANGLINISTPKQPGAYRLVVTADKVVGSQRIVVR